MRPSRTHRRIALRIRLTVTKTLARLDSNRFYVLGCQTPPGDDVGSVRCLLRRPARPTERKRRAARLPYFADHCLVHGAAWWPGRRGYGVVRRGQRAVPARIPRHEERSTKPRHVQPVVLPPRSRSVPGGGSVTLSGGSLTNLYLFTSAEPGACLMSLWTRISPMIRSSLPTMALRQLRFLRAAKGSW